MRGSRQGVAPRASGATAGVPPFPLADEREQLVAALASAGGNKQEAALALGLSRRALYRRLERHGFTIEARWGSYEGDPWTPAGDVWVVLARLSAKR